VRYDQADEADHSAHRDRGADQQRRNREGDAPCTSNRDPELCGTLLAEAQHVELAGVAQQPDDTDHQIHRAREHQPVALHLQAAHQPEENAVRLEEIRQRVERHDQRTGEGVADHAGEQKGVRLQPAVHGAESVDDQHRRQSAGKGTDRHQKRRQRPAGAGDDQGQHAAERRPARDTEQVRLGERIAQQRLQYGSRSRQRATDDDPHQRTRQADTKEDHRIDVALRRTEERPPQVDVLRPISALPHGGVRTANRTQT
jgi:hypothetical protein